MTTRTETALCFLAVLLGSCSVQCWGPARADEPARVDAATVCAVHRAVSHRKPLPPATCATIARALSETPDPVRMMAIGVNESNFRPRAINAARPGVFDLGLMQVRCVTLGAVAEETGSSSANTEATTTPIIPRDRCTNGPARGLYAHQLLDPAVNIRTAWAAYEMHGRSPAGYNGATGKRAKRYRQRIEAIEAALMGLPFVAPDKRTRELCRRIQKALKGEPRS